MPFYASKHKGLENHVETPELVLVQLAALVLRCILDILGKPFIEFIVRVEKARHDEVQQRP